MTGKALRFARLDTDCFVPLTHKLNDDGYFRKRWGEEIEMFHRFIYRAHHGLDEIPEGFEIDHICRIRACCNPEHLQLLEGTQHTIETNRARYAARLTDAYRHWKETRCTGTALAAIFNVSFGQGCRWIRDWKSGLIPT